MKAIRLLVPILLLACPSLLFAQRPLSGEIRVNVQTHGSPSFADVAMSSRGDFAVLWLSQDQDDLTYSIRGRRYAPSGAPVTGEIEILGGVDLVSSAAVAVLADGSFVVVYSAYTDVHDNQGTFLFEGRRYGADGAPLGAFAIGTGHAAADLSVRARPDGGFVVVWEAYRQVVPQISFRLFSADATPLGRETSITTGNDPAAAVGPNGEIVMGWMKGEEGDGGDPLYFVTGQRLAPNGRPRGGRFIASEKDPRFVQDIQLAKDGSGSFLVVWKEDFGRLGPGVFARRYDRNGRALGGIVQLFSKLLPARITMERDGSFVMVWSAGTAEDSDVFGQRFTAVGPPAGPPFRINTTTRGRQGVARVAGNGAGRFVAVWLDQEDSLGAADVFARLYQTR